MEQITVRIKDKRKAKNLLDFLKTLDFVESVASTDMPVEKDQGEEADFFALAGLWAGRNVSIQSLREKAWPYRV
jgi:hypothetical protein